MAIECFFLNDTDNQNSAGPILLTIRWHVQCSLPHQMMHKCSQDAVTSRTLLPSCLYQWF